MPNRHEMKPTPARNARQGEIVLKSPGRRTIFIAELAGIVVLGLILGLVA